MAVFALWIVPLLIIAPLFSRDVYSYVAQGEMMSHHISPYHYGPGVLGAAQTNVTIILTNQCQVTGFLVSRTDSNVVVSVGGGRSGLQLTMLVHPGDHALLHPHRRIRRGRVVPRRLRAIPRLRAGRRR